MKYRSYPNNDVGSSVVNTNAFPQIRSKFKVPLLVENAVKDGIPMMYWTCLCIGMHGRYAIDVRDLPNADASVVDQHSRATQTAVQRAIAFLLIDAAFPDLDSMLSWCDKHGEKLTDWSKRQDDSEVVPILHLLTHLTNKRNDIRHWLLCWLAYPLQNPGAKLSTAVVMQGAPGSGKSFLFDLMSSIYGDGAVHSTGYELRNIFNDWCSNKQLAVFEEFTSTQLNLAKLKSLITADTLPIYSKGKPMRIEPNQMNIVFLSGSTEFLNIENGDRRFLVISPPPAREAMYYADLAKWRDAGGIAAFHLYLLDYPLGDFGPETPAPQESEVL